MMRRIRRIKCDERLPACLKCTSTGRTCDGYAPPRTLLFEVSRDEGERRSFHYFRERTAPELSGDAGKRFWDGFVLRASYSQEVVRHAIAAIGALHESLELETGVQALTARGFAFEQYSKAITILTKADHTLSMEDVLIACILFTWFENLQGNFDISLTHLRSGLKILDAWRANPNSRPLQIPVSTAVIHEDLAPMIDRLTGQASVFLRSTDQPNPVIHDSSLPVEFSNLAEAHRYFYQIIHWTCHSLQVKTKVHGKSYIQAELITQILWKLDQWLALLDEHMQESTEKGKAKTAIDQHWRIQSALHLRMQHQNAMIMLKSLPYSYETMFDGQLAHFSNIIDLAQKFFDEDDRMGMHFTHMTSSHSFEHDHAIIPTLFMTACRCRDPHIRRQAIALLRRSHRKEDIWDSDVAASMAEYLMLREEEGLGEIKSCGDVLDSNRLYLIAGTFYAYDLAEKQLQVRYNTLDFSSTTIGAKLHCLRSGHNIVVDGIEDFWWNYLCNPNPVDIEEVFSRQAGGGLFPQLAKSNARLWSILNCGNAMRCIGRFGSPSICGWLPFRYVENCSVLTCYL